ncbi:NADH dehydrogenase [ubiquinone] 1 alpha subcomplex subunit 11 isoform X1 [Elgaria multicarinata webbii]|uniref:NADH dehydrogenase [ubiquinone] 1 alpha subcomplex subunit 11 isoform X1 n=1 Tax=Elgaria multicarinata webbii TaxID=159646 RepID=UPI002FCD63E4
MGLSMFRGLLQGVVGGLLDLFVVFPESPAWPLWQARCWTNPAGHAELRGCFPWPALAGFSVPVICGFSPSLSPFVLVSTATLGAVFGATTCISAQIREAPDDPLNYLIGGCASGVVLGARAHSFATGTTACVGFGVVAALIKIGKLEGWEFLGPRQS